MRRHLAQLKHFAPALIAWQREHGRHDLPWQGTRDPYRVWLSEIMLQQTQVSTVMGYYERFLRRFPDLPTLARADLDEVLTLWSGLGYYSRARNLHRCAQVLVTAHDGRFPDHWASLVQLPGIGESTAAAIAAFCFGQPVSILDGNVRRVLSRLLAFEGDLATTMAQRQLRDMAQELLPSQPSAAEMIAYTQGLMDLGAGICARSRPACANCPVSPLCQAHAQGRPAHFPINSRRLVRRHENWWLLVVHCPAHGCVWLERRPKQGIWAELMCPPAYLNEAQALAAADATGSEAKLLPAVSHALTHRELLLHPVLVHANSQLASTFSGSGQWAALAELGDYALPTPVRALLDRLPRAQAQDNLQNQCTAKIN